MTSKRVKIESIDLASYLTAAGFTLKIYRSDSGNRAIFDFPDSPEITAAIIAYEEGGQLLAKRLLNARSRLFREASRVVREGGRL